MARSLEQRLADLEKTVLEFFTGRSKKKTSARKSSKAKKPTSRPAKKTKSAKTSKRKAAR